MSKPTWKQRVVAYLIAMGYHHDTTSGRPSIHYDRYSRGEQFYFVSQHGSVYFGLNPVVRESIPMTNRVHGQVIIWEEKQTATSLPKRTQQCQ